MKLAGAKGSASSKEGVEACIGNRAGLGLRKTTSPPHPPTAKYERAGSPLFRYMSGELASLCCPFREPLAMTWKILPGGPSASPCTLETGVRKHHFVEARSKPDALLIEFLCSTRPEMQDHFLDAPHRDLLIQARVPGPNLIHPDPSLGPLLLYSYPFR